MNTAVQRLSHHLSQISHVTEVSLGQAIRLRDQKVVKGRQFFHRSEGPFLNGSGDSLPSSMYVSLYPNITVQVASSCPAYLRLSFRQDFLSFPSSEETGQNCAYQSFFVSRDRYMSPKRLIMMQVRFEIVLTSVYSLLN